MSTKRLITTTPWTEKILTLLQNEGTGLSDYANAALEDELLPRAKGLRDASEKVLSEYADTQEYNEEIYRDARDLLSRALRWLPDHRIQLPDVLWEIFRYVPPDITRNGKDLLLDEVDTYFVMPSLEGTCSDCLFEALEKNPNYRKQKEPTSRTLLNDLLANWKYVWELPEVYVYLDVLFEMETSSIPILEDRGEDPGYPEVSPLQAVKWVKAMEEEYLSEIL